jgi:hypothetical protein
MRGWIRALAIAALVVLGTAPALADDWKADRLRGVVLELVEGEWLPLERGAVVPDDRMIKTLNGRVTFVRGNEAIDLGPNTLVQIIDEARGGRPYTRVKQHFGTVAVEADVREVEHFAVHTPYLTAVVKGTRFVVSSSKHSSNVKVRRGAVSVVGLESSTQTVVLAGQSAATSGAEPLRVSGRGELPDVVPLDATAKGKKGRGVTVSSENSGSGKGKGSGSGNGNGNGSGSGSGNEKDKEKDKDKG